MVQTPILVAAVTLVYIVVTTVFGDNFHIESLEIKLLGCSIKADNIRRVAAGVRIGRSRKE